MNEADLERKMEEVRKGAPECFTDPEIRPGEIYTGHYPQEILDILFSSLVEVGIRRLRVGDVAVMKLFDPMGGFLSGLFDLDEIELPHYPVFVQLRDVVIAQDRGEEEARRPRSNSLCREG